MKHLKLFENFVKEYPDRLELINIISDISNFDKDELKRMHTNELEELYDELETDTWAEEIGAETKMYQNAYK